MALPMFSVKQIRQEKERTRKMIALTQGELVKSGTRLGKATGKQLLTKVVIPFTAVTAANKFIIQPWMEKDNKRKYYYREEISEEEAEGIVDRAFTFIKKIFASFALKKTVSRITDEVI